MTARCSERFPRPCPVRALIQRRFHSEYRRGLQGGMGQCHERLYGKHYDIYPVSYLMLTFALRGLGGNLRVVRDVLLLALIILRIARNRLAVTPLKNPQGKSASKPQSRKRIPKSSNRTPSGCISGYRTGNPPDTCPWPYGKTGRSSSARNCFSRSLRSPS